MGHRRTRRAANPWSSPSGRNLVPPHAAPRSSLALPQPSTQQGLGCDAALPLVEAVALAHQIRASSPIPVHYLAAVESYVDPSTRTRSPGGGGCGSGASCRPRSPALHGRCRAHPEHRVRERLDDLPLELDLFFLGQTIRPARWLPGDAPRSGPASTRPAPAASARTRRARPARRRREAATASARSYRGSPAARAPPSAPSIDRHRAAPSTRSGSHRRVRRSTSLVKTITSGTLLALVRHAPTSLRQIAPAARPTR